MGFDRYQYGGEVVKLPSGPSWWKRRVISPAEDDVTFVVTTEVVGRADKIAQFMYGSAEFMWVILQFNGLRSPSQLVTGLKLKLPQKYRLVIRK